MRILVIDDDQNISNLIKDSLKQYYVVDIANNGKEGLHLLHDVAYDVVILDLKLTLNMPDLEGVEVCKKIHESGQYTLKETIFYF